MRTVRTGAGELSLRPWAPADAAAVCRAYPDPHLQHWLSGLPGPYPGADGPALRLGIFDGGELLGGVALHSLDRGAGTAEPGCWWARGRRVAERGARALPEWAFGDALGLARVGRPAAVGHHAARLTARRLGFRMIGELPGDRPGDPDRWPAVLLPGDLTAADAEVSDPVRRTARTSGGPHPTLPAGPVTLRPPRLTDLPGILACRRAPDVARWFGVPPPYTGQQAREHVERNAPRRWAPEMEAVFAVAGPGGGYEWRAEVGNDASRRVAERAGCTAEGLLRGALRVDGTRRDCWVGSLLRGGPA